MRRSLKWAHSWRSEVYSNLFSSSHSASSVSATTQSLSDALREFKYEWTDSGCVEQHVRVKQQFVLYLADALMWQKLSVLSQSYCVSSQIKEKTTLILGLKVPRGLNESPHLGSWWGGEALGVWSSNLLHKPGLLFEKMRAKVIC